MILITENLGEKNILVAQLLPALSYKVTKNAAKSFDSLVDILEGNYSYLDIPDREIKEKFGIPGEMTVKSFCELNIKNNEDLNWNKDAQKIKEFFAVKGRKDNNSTSFHVSKMAEVDILEKVAQLENRGHRAVHDDIIKVGTRKYLEQKGYDHLLKELDQE